MPDAYESDTYVGFRSVGALIRTIARDEVEARREEGGGHPLGIDFVEQAAAQLNARLGYALQGGSYGRDR